MKKYLIILVIMSSCFSIKAQDKATSILSKQEMYEDFDFLIENVSKANPHLPIYKKVMHIDVVNEIKKLRSNIDTFKNAADFYMLVFRALRKIPENHTRLLKFKNFRHMEWFKEEYPNYFDSLSIKKNKDIWMKTGEIYGMKEYKEMQERRKYDLPLSYIDGEFYTIQNIKLSNKKTGEIETIGANWKLLKINNETVNEFLSKNIDKYNFTFHINKYDVKNKLLYNEQLLMNDAIIGKNVNLTFYDTKKKDTVLIDFINHNKKRFREYYSGIDIPKYSEAKPVHNKTLFFDNILYIKIPSMNPSSIKFLEDSIPKYKNHKIEKIVVDIRNNGGGSDYVWYKLLSMIIDTTFCRTQKLGITNWSQLQNKIPMDFDSLPLFYDKNLQQNYRLIDDVTNCDKIEPDSNSLNYKGEIYLLHNENCFSSATAFVAFALSNDRVVAVGESNGYLGGYGVDPFLFQLPNSKLLFIMHSTIHIPVNSNNIEDYFWNKTEVEVNLTPEFKSLMYRYTRMDIYSEKFLKNKDLFFRKILHL